MAFIIFDDQSRDHRRVVYSVSDEHLKEFTQKILCGVSFIYGVRVSKDHLITIFFIFFIIFGILLLSNYIKFKQFYIILISKFRI